MMVLLYCLMYEGKKRGMGRCGGMYRQYSTKCSRKARRVLHAFQFRVAGRIFASTVAKI